jgi:hypothetical protein
MESESARQKKKYSLYSHLHRQALRTLRPEQKEQPLCSFWPSLPRPNASLDIVWYTNNWSQQFRNSFKPFQKDWHGLYVFLKIFMFGFPQLAMMSLDRMATSLVDFGAYRNLLGVLADYTTAESFRFEDIIFRNRTARNSEMLDNILLRIMDPTRFLILRLGSHCHTFRCPIKGLSSEECPLVTALDKGANPNCTQYGKTPLQLAVERSDDVAVRLLLERGADPNLVGAEDGDQPKGNEFSPDRRGWSPLRLCRRAPCLWRTALSDFGEPPMDMCYRVHDRACESREPGNLRQRIELMLCERGAREFELSMDATKIHPQLVELPG